MNLTATYADGLLLRHISVLLSAAHTVVERRCSGSKSVTLDTSVRM
jgi:hypothetical protein